MVPAMLQIIVNALLLLPIYLCRCWLIRLSRSVEDDGYLYLIVVHAFALDSISHSLLFSIKYDSKGLDGPSGSRLDSGMTAGKYSSPVSAGQSHSLTLQVINLLLISAIVKLSLER